MNVIDSLLLKKGYIRINNIVIDGENGQKVAYAKAYNIAGDICFIDITKPGKITIQLSDRTLVKISEGTSIPSKIMMNSLDCAGTGVCGIAFDCNGEYCMARRNDSGQVESSAYITVSKPAEALIGDVNSIVAYPIITLDEIENNNEDCLRRVRSSTIYIQRGMLKESMVDFSHRLAATTSLSNQLKSFQNVYVKSYESRNKEHKRLLSELDAHRTRQMSGQDLPHENVSEICKITDRLYNLTLINNDIVEYSSILSDYKKQLMDLEIKIRDAQMAMYIKNRRIFNHHQCETMKPSVWGLPEEFISVSDEDLFKGNFGNFNGDGSVACVRRLVGNKL